MRDNYLDPIDFNSRASPNDRLLVPLASHAVTRARLVCRLRKFTVPVFSRGVSFRVVYVMTVLPLI